MTFEKERKAPVRRGKVIYYSINDPHNEKPETETKQDDIYLLGGGGSGNQTQQTDLYKRKKKKPIS